MLSKLRNRYSQILSIQVSHTQLVICVCSCGVYVSQNLVICVCFDFGCSSGITHLIFSLVGLEHAEYARVNKLQGLICAHSPSARVTDVHRHTYLIHGCSRFGLNSYGCTANNLSMKLSPQSLQLVILKQVQNKYFAPNYHINK